MIDTFNKTDKSQASKNSPYLQQKNGTLNPIDKSRYNQKTNLSNKSNIIEKPTEIDIFEENKYPYDFSGQGDYLEDIIKIRWSLLLTRLTKMRLLTQ